MKIIRTVLLLTYSFLIGTSQHILNLMERTNNELWWLNLLNFREISKNERGLEIRQMNALATFSMF